MLYEIYVLSSHIKTNNYQNGVDFEIKIKNKIKFNLNKTRI